MPDDVFQSRRHSRNSSNPARPQGTGKAASDQAIAELERMMKVRLKSESRQRATAGTAPLQSHARGALFPKSDAAIHARDEILGIERDDEDKNPARPKGEDGCLYLDLEDQFTPADRVFFKARSGLLFGLRILAGTLTVIAGCELAYATNLLAFEGGRIGAVLAAVVACFAAARWITRE